MKKNIILSLCDHSGQWSDPYLNAGYEVIKLDLKNGYDARLFPSKTSSQARFPRDFGSIEDLTGRVHGVLCAPVCTVFSGSGACHPRSDKDILSGLSLVDACIRIAYVVNPTFWALENPVGKLRKWIGAPVMTFNPCDYGDPYKKRTLLWGNFNTDLKKNPVDPVIPSPLHQKLGGRSEKTKTLRSNTPKGFAKAFFKANP